MVKIYVHAQGVVLAGKAWEVGEKLKEYQKLYSTVAEWAGQANRSESTDTPVDLMTYRLNRYQKNLSPHSNFIKIKKTD
ncbi:Z-ring formation inhibitor MciZ [Neobacillus sp. SM06]|uniref:Z-ring formation inhibitor MciZ n=1 Tax=Neobacillus sp. SM06 TaxID=3422492 RepID=UPI003D2BC460